MDGTNMTTANGSITEIAQRAQKALAVSPVYALRDLRVQEDGDHLLLEGEVASFYHKQLAQEAVRAVARQARLVNTINVAAAPPR